MKIGIIGSEGVLGSTLSFGFTKLGHDVFGYDIKNKEKTLSDIVNELLEIYFICVPTPVGNDGECDASIVKKCIEDLLVEIRKHFTYCPIIVIKSTVIPGTTRYLQHLLDYDFIAFVPEFLRERCAITDFVEMQNLLAIGTYQDWIYDKIVECHGNYPKHIVRLKPSEAEFLKYYHNSIAALRIIFANEMYELASAMELDYIAIKNALIKSAQLPDKYLDVSKNLRGFCGTCLPKDTLALLKLAEDYNVDLDLLETVVVKNQKYQPTVYPGMRS